MSRQNLPSGDSDVGVYQETMVRKNKLFIGMALAILFIGVVFLSRQNLLKGILPLAWLEKPVLEKIYAKQPVEQTVNTFPYDLNIFNAAISKNYPNRMATSGPIVAGLIPHHDLASDLSAEFFSSLAQKQKVKTFIIIGPLHSDASLAPIISGRFIWDAGFARVENNYDILDELVASHLVSYDEKDMQTEHSIYNIVPFIAHYFPDAKIVPIAMTSHNSPAQCFALAAAMQKYLSSGDTVLLASIDFSHYLPSQETPAKNARMIELMNDKDYYTIAGLHSDYLDSPASLNVLLKAADLENAGANILASTNSGEITGAPVASSTSYISAYFAKNNIPLLGGVDGAAPDGVGSEAGKVSKSYCASQTGCVIGGLPTASSSQLKLLFFGDIMLDRHVGEKIKAAGNEDFIFSKLADAGVFQGNDLVSANLEGAVTDNGAHLPPFEGIDFAFAPQLVGELKKYNFNYFNIANNHLSDQGKDGIIQTENNLTSLGFNFAGCADRQVGDCTSKIVEINGRKIGFTGASMVYGVVDEKMLADKVKALASSTDLVIAQMHWGTEYQHEPNKNQIELAHKLIDAGADMVIAHHPHVVEGIEIYKGKPIFYSLGNFVFDQYFSTDTQEELGVKIAVEEKKFTIDLLPIKSESTNLRLMNNVEKNKFLSELAGWSTGSDEFKAEIKAGKIVINKD
jgi:poly-gamma-glutamate synthesis protein (capsule biosynthesis protein)